MRFEPLLLINPATEEVIDTLDVDEPDEIVAKVDVAREHMDQWRFTPLEERKRVIRAFRDLLRSNRETLSQVLSMEMGKPIVQARREIETTLPRIDFFLNHVDAVVQDEWVHQEAGLLEKVSHDPLGVITNISAWNYPYFVGSNVYIPALLTGNTVLYKPSEHAALTGIRVGELLWEAGVPAGVFQVIVGAGPTGAALLNHRVDGIFFTGSYETGRAISKSVAGTLTKVGLELGGKDPVYVTDDIDPDAAAPSVADGAFYNSGQSCCAVERVYVHTDVFDSFLETFVETMQAYVVGDPSDEKTDLGPLARSAQRDVVRLQIEDAVSKGARVIEYEGEVPENGWFVRPKVVVDVNHEMALMKEETFGPVIGVQRVASDEEAQALMQDTDYGLTAGVYCRDHERAISILQQVDIGSAYINCCDRVSPRLPWSGRGSSGIGATLSSDGIRTFLKPKAWHIRG